MWKKVASSLLVAVLVMTMLSYMPLNIGASQSDAESYDWSTVNYLVANAECTEYSDIYKMVVGQGNANIDVIQNPGFATAKGVYVTFADADFGDITINGQVTSSYDKQGAGIIFHMSMFTEEYSSLVVKNGSGAVKAELYVYNKNGSSTENPVSSDVDITGFQISTSYGGVDGNLGFRTIYQAEPTIEGKKPVEIGIVYGLVYGDTPVTKEDIVYGSENEYVKSYAATDEGKIGVVMGTSDTADYYARTMECDDSLSSEAYTSQYYIRAYAKLSDEEIVYSDVKTYTVYKIADYIYQNNLTPRKSSYDYIYNKILKKVDSSYTEGDFNWSGTIVKM